MAFDLDIPKDWEKEWEGMPEFMRANHKPFQKITINFNTWGDVKAFGELIGRRLTKNTDTLWFPFNRLKIPTGTFIDGKENE